MSQTSGNDATSDDDHDALDVSMVDLLVCPLTKQPLRYDEEAREFVSDAAKLAYPVRGGVPILLPSEARALATPTGIRHLDEK
ncbi:MAG: Trm112 family protein [Pseudomonadota bacterium]